MKNIVTMIRSITTYKTRFLAFLLILLMSTGTMIASDTAVGGIWYTFDATAQTAVVTYEGSSYSLHSNEYSGDVNIPETVTYKNVTYNVIGIDDNTFYQCTGLTSVVIPNSITSIGVSAFLGCDKLTSVSVGTGVITIGNNAFRNCSKLTTIVIPNSVTTIGEKCFDGCSKLANVTLGMGIKKIDKYLFNGCSSLSSIVLPNQIVAIWASAFANCTSLASISLPSSLTSIGDNAFQSCTSLISVNIGNKVSSLGASAFVSCTGLISVSLSSKLTSIPSSVFKGCTALVDVEIPSAVTKINDRAFYECKQLKNITIPAGVTSIGELAFYNCISMEAMTSLATTPPSAGTNCFLNVPQTIPIYIPCGSLSAYSAATRWKDFLSLTENCAYAITWANWNGSVLKVDSVLEGETPSYTGESPTKPATAEYTYTFKGWTPDIVAVTGDATYTAVYDSIPRCPLASGTCGANGDNLTWELSCDSVLTISGTGKMKVYASTSQIPWYIHKESIKEIVLEDSVTSIGKNAFRDCTNLTSVTIGNSITSIEDRVFKDCSSLTSIEIPKGVTSIGTAVFINCSSLTSIVWKARTMSSSGAIFSDIDKQITSFVFGDEVEEIPSMCCVDMFNLISISIPNSVISIGDRAFGGCYSLGNIYVYWIEPINISGIFDSETHNSANLHVPCRAVPAYRAAEGWKDFNNIVGMDCATYAITWQNYDGFILATDSVLENELPQYTGADPTKPATIEYNYIFDGWTPEVVPVTGDAIYTAHFDSAKVVYNVDVTIPDTIETHGSVTVEGSTTFGDTITLTPVPEDGWYFVEWSDGNTENPREIIVTGDTVIYPIFAQCEEIIVTFSEVITKGESYEFAGMSLMQRGTYMDTTVLANGCDSITVLKLNVVKAKTFNLRVVVNDETMGTVEGAGTFTQGQEVTITAIPASSKYVFVRWYNEDEDINVYDNPYTFTLNRNLQIRAVFRRGKK